MEDRPESELGVQLSITVRDESIPLDEWAAGVACGKYDTPSLMSAEESDALQKALKYNDLKAEALRKCGVWGVRMKPLSEMSKDERSLLLYVEARAVDHSGRMNPRQLNDIDRRLLDEWKEAGALDYGRICAADCNTDGSLWVRPGPELVALAQEERRARMERLWESRSWQTTEEVRE